MESLAVERTIWIDAPRERVWSAITDPAQVGAWFSPGTHWRGTGVKVGGRLSVYDPASDTDLFTQVIDLVDPLHQLVTRSEPTPPDPVHVTTWTLEEEQGGTRLTLTFSGYEHEPDDVRQHNIDENAVGFGQMLENLKAHIQGEPLPYPQGF